MLFGKGPVDRLRGMDLQKLRRFIAEADVEVEKLENRIERKEVELRRTLAEGAEASGARRANLAGKCRTLSHEVQTLTEKVVQKVTVRTLARRLATIREYEMDAEDDLFERFKELVDIQDPEDLQEILAEASVQTELKQDALQEMEQYSEMYAERRAVADLGENEFTEIMDELARIEEEPIDEAADKAVRQATESEPVPEGS